MADIKQFVFFDFEMLCSDTGMAFDEMEAIRLGAVKYDLETEKVSYFDQFIRPQNTEPLTKFCKDLTGINDEDLVNAESFKEVFTGFLEWVGGIKKTKYFSWSPSDLFRLKIDTMRHEIPERTLKKIEQRYTDFQKVFTIQVSKKPISVEDALKLYNLEFIGEKHNPMYDAYNTFRIYQTFMNKPIQSDLIMVQKFILNDIQPIDLKDMNIKLRTQLYNDARQVSNQLRHIYRLNDMKKLLKPIGRTALKYENVVLNRSGIFSEDTIHYAQCFLSFYEDFVHTYNEHFSYSSKTVILHEHQLRPIEQIKQTNAC
ncbi:exonuclease [Bacillus sp. UMB0899]|nr:exonuclease [Bacillus sp. UMB0899]